MSTRLAIRVYGSALPEKLKIVAARLALYADERGGSVRPAMDTLAKQCSCSTREVQRRMVRLRDMRIVTPEGRTTGGRGHTVRYAFNEHALPAIKGDEVLSSFDDDAAVVKGDRVSSPFTTAKRVTENGLKGDEALSPDRERKRSRSPEGIDFSLFDVKSDADRDRLNRLVREHECPPGVEAGEWNSSNGDQRVLLLLALQADHGPDGDAYRQANGFGLLRNQQRNRIAHGFLTTVEQRDRDAKPVRQAVSRSGAVNLAEVHLSEATRRRLKAAW
jgi:hypothetical protein